MKKATLTLLIFFGISASLALATYYLLPDEEAAQNKQSNFEHALSVSTKKDKFARFSFENRKLINPETGKVPANMRAKELAFAKTIKPAHKTADIDTLEWVQRGPYNIGGRTRALAVDITNENVLLAGGVSGGIWRSEDGGQSWAKISTNDEHQGITCIMQDTRPRAYRHLVLWHRRRIWQFRRRRRLVLFGQWRLQIVGWRAKLVFLARHFLQHTANLRYQL